MPKVKTETRGKDRYDYHVKADGMFTCRLPLWTHAVLGYSEVQAKTLDDCEQAVRKALGDYAAARTEKRKVILFGFACCVDIWRDNRRFFSVGHTGVKAGPSVEPLHFADGTAVGLWAVVATEVKITHNVNGEDRPSYTYQFQNSSIPSGATPNSHSMDFHHAQKPLTDLLPWTQERENFFARMVLGLEAVALQLAQLSNPAKAMEIADSGKFQMLAETCEKT